MKITKGEFEHMEPAPELVHQLKLKVAASVKEQYPAGLYKKDAKQLGSIVNLMVSEYNKLLEVALEQVADNEIIKALLWQYGESHKLLISGASGAVTQEQIDDANIRTRAHKYLAERCLAIGREDALCKNKDKYLRYLVDAMVCAEQIVHLSIVSDQIVNDVMVSDFEITVPSGEDTIQIHGNRNDYNDFVRRLALSNQMRDQLFPGRTFDLDEDSLTKALEPAFSDHLLFRFGEVMELIEELDKYSRSESGSSFTTKLVDKGKVIAWMKEYAKHEFTLSDKQCEQILAGLTVFPQKVAAGNKGFFNPQLESRALKRCFLATTFDGRPHLAWVPELVKTSVEAISKALVFGEFPAEWSLTKAIQDKVATISNERGDWFEKEVARIMPTLGINGYPSRKKIGERRFLVPLLPKPGELDFIGWSPTDRAIIVFEAKMLKWAGEPRNVRNQDQKFIESEGFVETLNKKTEWIANNLQIVVDALKSEHLNIVDPVSINSAFITFEPVFAKYKVKKFPVVSIAEFVDSYTAHGKWPYTNGVRLLS